MTTKQEHKWREFWLAKPDLDFDLNWKKVYAAEFPHKNTLVDSVHVIEYSALTEAHELLREVSAALNLDATPELLEKLNNYVEGLK